MGYCAGLQFSLISGITVLVVLLSTGPLGAKLNFIDVHELLRPWTEDATWLETGTGESWDQPGASGPGKDISILPCARIVEIGADKAYRFDLTSAVRRWAQEASSNHGVEIVMAGGTFTEMRFRSSNFSSSMAMYRPRLVLVHGDTAPEPLPPETHYTFLPIMSKE